MAPEPFFDVLQESLALREPNNLVVFLLAATLALLVVLAGVVAGAFSITLGSINGICKEEKGIVMCLK